jgi:lipopolysaccharide transport system ATP-binding protein
LEPEILIVDEVLAVGDAQFQKKCLGKMEDVGKEGRTVIFVSHNMAAMRALCSRALLLKEGQVLLDTDIETASTQYLAEDAGADSSIVWDKDNAPQSQEIRFIEAYILSDKGDRASAIDCKKCFSISIKYEVLKPIHGLRVGFSMQNVEGTPMCGSNDPMAWAESSRLPGEYISTCSFPGHILNAGKYSISFGSDMSPYTNALISTKPCISLMIEDMEGHGPLNEKLPGVIRPNLSWSIGQLSLR